MHCVQKEETIGIALTGHAFSGSVRQLTRGIPSLVPVPRNMISEVLSLRLPPLGNSTPNNPSTNAPDSAASCQTSNLRLTHIPHLSTTSFNIAMQGNALYSCENPQISFRFLPDFTPFCRPQTFNSLQNPPTSPHRTRIATSSTLKKIHKSLHIAMHSTLNKTHKFPPDSCPTLSHSANPKPPIHMKTHPLLQKLQFHKPFHITMHSTLKIVLEFLPDSYLQTHPTLLQCPLIL